MIKSFDELTPEQQFAWRAGAYRYKCLYRSADERASAALAALKEIELAAVEVRSMPGMVALPLGLMQELFPSKFKAERVEAGP